MPSVRDKLRLHEVSGLMAELRTPFDRLQNVLGMKPGGSMTVKTRNRQVEMDIANPDREPAGFSAPGSNAAVVAPTVVGSRTHTIPRTYEKRNLDSETLDHLRLLGSNASVEDEAGMSYLELQMQRQKERTDLWREFLCYSFMRGTGKFQMSGTKWTPVAPGATGGQYISIDWNLPAASKNQLGGIIGTSWASSSAPIIDDIVAVNAKMVENSGYTLDCILCNSIMWSTHIQGNTQVQDRGGAVNSPTEVWKFQEQNRADGLPDSLQIGLLRGIPWVKFIIIDDILKLGGTNTKYLADSEACFLPKPNKSWMFMYEGRETTKQDGGKKQQVVGKADWLRWDVPGDVPIVELHSLDNAMPVGNPNAWMFATPVF